MAVAREFIDNVQRPWLEDWYSSVVRPWDTRPPPLGVHKDAITGPGIGEQQEDGDSAEAAGYEEPDDALGAKAFEVGDIVEAKAQGYQRWWEATIVALRQDGAFEICWAVDPQVDTIKKPSEVRRKKVRGFKAKEPAEAALPPWLLDTHAVLVSLAEKEDAAPVTTAKVALVVYGFDEALRFDRFAGPANLAAEQPTLDSKSGVEAGQVTGVSPAGLTRPSSPALTAVAQHAA